LVGFSERVDCGAHYSVLFVRPDEFAGGARQPASHFLEVTDRREQNSVKSKVAEPMLQAEPAAVVFYGA
jgi:hypothetical protein